MDEFLISISVFQILTDIYDIAIGSALVYGALKWRKGLLTTTAFYWGIVLGFMGGAFVFGLTENILILFIMVAVGAIGLPIMTYRIPAVNRFVLGFLVVMKLSYMFTTYLWKNEAMDFGTTIALPLFIATVAGIIFMLWHQLSVLPFALGCVFIGASQVAPTIAKYVNQFIFGVTQDYSLIFDPIDFVFALFKIELTDGWTLLFMIVLMAIGVPMQLKYITEQGYTYDTPIIAFETDKPEMNGRIIS